MDRFLDEQENLSGAGLANTTAAALQAIAGQVSSSDNHHHHPHLNVGTNHQSRQGGASSSSSVLPHNLFTGNSSVTITAHHSPVKTINVSGDRTQTILINKDKDSDKHHHHHYQPQQQQQHSQYNNHGMSI